MTALDAVFAVLEGSRFAAEVNVASNLKIFLRALVSQPAVQELATAMSVRGVCEQVCERVEELARQEILAEYEHPSDAAMAAYLWLLSTRDEELAARAASRVTVCPNCWWAAKVAENILSSSSCQLASGSSSATMNGQPPTPVGNAASSPTP